MAVRFYGDSGAAGLTFTATAGEAIAQNDLVGRTGVGTVKVAKGYSPRNAQTAGIGTGSDSAMAVAYCSFYDVMIVVHNSGTNSSNSPAISLIGKNGYQNTLAAQQLTSGALDRTRSTALIWDDTLRAGVIFTSDNGGGGGTLRYWHFEVNSATSVTVSARTITSVGNNIDNVAADLIASGEGLIIQQDSTNGLKAAYVAFSNTAITTFSSASAISGSTSTGQAAIKAEPGADRALVCFYSLTDTTSKAAMLSKNGTSAPTWGSSINLDGGAGNYQGYSIDYDTINSSWLVGSIYGGSRIAARIMTNSGTTVTATGNWAVANNSLAFQEPIALADSTTGKNFVFGGFTGPGYIKVTPSSVAQTANIEADISAANTGFNTFSSQYTENGTGVKIQPWGNRFYYLVGQETGSDGANFYSFDPEEETFVGAASQTVGIATSAAANTGTVTVSGYVESDAYTGFSTGETLYIDVAGNIVANNTGSIIGVGKDATAVYILPNSTAFATAITE